MFNVDEYYNEERQCTYKGEVYIVRNNGAVLRCQKNTSKTRPLDNKWTFGVIGDSTFLHSGITNLIDAVSSKTPMTAIILDNSIVAMTGCQKTILPSSQLEPLILGLGVEKEHLRVLATNPSQIDENARIITEEAEYPGPSVIIMVRECLEAFRLRNKAKKIAELYDLLLLHAVARGELTDKKEEADEIFDIEEGTTPFDIDTIVIPRVRSKKVKLLNKNGKGVEFEYPKFSTFAIWTPFNDAPFVCLEPWYGRCDCEDFSGELKEREWANMLEANEEFYAEYKIII